MLCGSGECVTWVVGTVLEARRAVLGAGSCLWKNTVLLGCAWAGDGPAVGTAELCCGKPGVIIQMSEQGLEHYS